MWVAAVALVMDITRIIIQHNAKKKAEGIFNKAKESVEKIDTGNIITLLGLVAIIIGVSYKK